MKSSVPQLTTIATSTPTLPNAHNFSPSSSSHPNNHGRTKDFSTTLPNDNDRLHRERDRNDRDGRGATPSSRVFTPTPSNTKTSGNVNSNTGISLASGGASVLGSASKRKRDQSPVIGPSATTDTFNSSNTGTALGAPAASSTVSTTTTTPMTVPGIKKEGSDWITMFNPSIKRVLDVGLVHTLLHDSYVLSTNLFDHVKADS